MSFQINENVFGVITLEHLTQLIIINQTFPIGTNNNVIDARAQNGYFLILG